MAKLKWTKTTDRHWTSPVNWGSDEAWTAECDTYGARIRKVTNGWMDKPPTFYVYRDARYLGSASTLEEAQKKAERNEVSPNRLEDVIPYGGPAFNALTKEERKSFWVEHDQIRARIAAMFHQREVKMSKYEGMDVQQLLNEYNKVLVPAAKAKGLDRYREMARFPDQETALKYIETIESSIVAADEGAKAAKRQKGPEVKPDAAEAPEAPAPAKGKAARKAAEAPEAPKGKGKAPAPAKAAPAAATGKGKAPAPAGLEGFLKAAEFRAGSGKGKAAALLFENLGRNVPLKEVEAAAFGGPNIGSISSTIKSIENRFKRNNLAYTIKVNTKEKSVGMYADGK